VEAASEPEKRVAIPRSLVRLGDSLDVLRPVRVIKHVIDY